MPTKAKMSPLAKADARARLQEAHVYLSTATSLTGESTAASLKVAASNAVMAGLAAADAICGLVLGERSAGDDHAQAVAVLKRATQPDPKPSNTLKRLLAEKPPAQYGSHPITARNASDLLRWAGDLVDQADRVASR